jgi:hypothetical protein
VACSCRPGRYSEAGPDWGWLVQAGRSYDVWALVEQGPCEKAIRAWDAENGSVPGVRFHFVPETRLEKVLRKTLLFDSMASSLWQHRAVRIAEHLHERHLFDLAHQLGAEPGYLWTLGIPFVWGPLDRLGFWSVRRARRAAREACVVLAVSGAAARELVRVLKVPVCSWADAEWQVPAKLYEEVLARETVNHPMWAAGLPD